MKEKGIVSSYAEYVALPLVVREDALLLAEGEALEQKRRDAHSDIQRRRARR